MNEDTEPTRDFDVEVRRTISTTVRVQAADADAARDTVDNVDYPLPPQDRWSGHKDWTYIVTDTASGEETEFNR